MNAPPAPSTCCPPPATVVFLFAFYTHGPAVRARYAASVELQTNVDGGGASRPAGSISRGCKLAHETCLARR